MLVRCLYASRAAQPMTSEVLDDILAQSAAKNPPHGITGMLCYTNDVFVQVLEGGRDAVCELFNAIVRDDRHQDVRILVFEEIAERRFGNWTMGQVNLEQCNPAVLMKYSETAAFDPFSCPGSATMAMLTDLLAAGSIAGRGKQGAPRLV